MAKLAGVRGSILTEFLSLVMALRPHQGCSSVLVLALIQFPLTDG